MRDAAAQIEIDEYSWYEGQMQGGEFHGQGVAIGANGCRYEGEWRNNMPNGHGTMTYPDGSVYSGQWKDSKFLGAADGADNDDDDDFKTVNEAVKTLQVLGRTSSLVARAPSSVRSKPLPDRSDDGSW